jgi:DNA polymerase-1
VWDIEVEHDHSYIAHGFINHNSSRKPNLQNIPRKGGLRNCFIAPRGFDLVEFDFSQLELRVAAQYSGDKNMCSILNNPKGDIHSQVGIASFKKPDGSDYPIAHFMSGEARVKAKVVGFSTIYGKTMVGLGFDLDCSVEEAANIFNYFFNGFPGLKSWIDNQQAFVTANGYIDTLFGRRIYISGAQSMDIYKMEAAFRYAVNYPVQSAASDILVLALNRVQKLIDRNKWPVKMILTVHDSLLFEVKKDFTKEFVRQVKPAMEKSIPQMNKVALFADYKVGNRWGELKEKNYRL